MTEMSKYERTLRRIELANKHFKNQKIMMLSENPNVRIVEPVFDDSEDDDDKAITIKVTIDTPDPYFMKRNTRIIDGDDRINVIFEIDQSYAHRDEQYHERYLHYLNEYFQMKDEMKAREEMMKKEKERRQKNGNGSNDDSKQQDNPDWFDRQFSEQRHQGRPIHRTNMHHGNEMSEEELMHMFAKMQGANNR